MNTEYYYYSHFIVEENRAPEELNNFPEITEPGRVEDRMGAQAV